MLEDKKLSSTSLPNKLVISTFSKGFRWGFKKEITSFLWKLESRKGCEVALGLVQVVKGLVGKGYKRFQV